MLFRALLAGKPGLVLCQILLVNRATSSRPQWDTSAADGDPLPWFTYPAIEYLSQFDFSGKRVFEYGAGNSSLFWAARAREVVAVESNGDGLQDIAAGQPDLQLNCMSVKRVTLNVSHGRKGSLMDRYRRTVADACAAICACVPGYNGMIIIDNSDRHYKGCDLLREQGFLQIDFSGLSPVNRYASTTSIFIHAQDKYTGSIFTA